jgi:hypothetical protein
MRLGKVIRLDERAAAAGPGHCPRCGRRGSTDYLDLVELQAKLHCPACWTCWDEAVQAPPDEAAEERRAAAAARRRRH